MPTTCQIDDQGPFSLSRPTTLDEVGEEIRTAIASHRAVFPLGGQTQLALGLPPTRSGVGLDLTALTRVIDYPARDMTITVEAGIRIAELHRLLASERQRLPIDVPWPDRATLGGSLAVNASGSRRYGAGTLRDYVIGITTINDEGQQTKAGGRVVKNVAGYDLCKLHIGALGTLGVIAQVTLKVRPLPETQAALLFGCASEALETLLNHLHQSRTRPIAIDLLNARAAEVLRRTTNLALPESRFVFLVGYEDSEAAVNWQMQQLIRELSPVGVPSVEALAGAVTDPLWQSLTDLPSWPERKLSFQATMLPSRVAAFFIAAAALPERPLLHAQAGSGIVHGHFAELTQTRADAILRELTALTAAEGNLTLSACPAEWKRSLPVWGKPRGDAWLMRQVKQKFDPHDAFNPGRFCS